MANLREHHFPDSESLADALALSVAERLHATAMQRGQALIAVSGGRSPAALFDRLAHCDLDWSQVTVTQVDERWVPLDHPASNSQLIRDHLLQGKAAAAEFVPLKADARSATEGQIACEAMLSALPLPFDLVLLGMGDDGHTASLFPHAPELAHGLATGSLCTAATATVEPRERMSLTLAGLLRSRLLILQLSGAAKRRVLDEALGDGPVDDMPVRAVLRQNQVPVELWLSD